METPTLISADQTWALWAVLLSAGAFGHWAETTHWGARLSGAVIAIGTTFVGVAVGHWLRRSVNLRLEGERLTMRRRTKRAGRKPCVHAL